MSREARAWAWDQARQRTIDDPLDLLILLNLADVADENGENAYPSQARLVRDCLSSERTISRRLKLLTDKGVIEVQKRSTRTRPTTYRLVGTDSESPANMASQTGDEAESPAIGSPLGRHSPATALRETSEEVELEREIKKKGSARAPNHAWDALVEVIGWEPKTGPEKARVGKAVKEIAAALPDGTSREDVAKHIRARAARYREHWPHAELTPESLVKHWSKFSPQAVRELAHPAPAPERGTLTRPELLARRDPADLTYEEFLESLQSLPEGERMARREARRTGLAWKVRTEHGEVPTAETGWRYQEEQGWVRREAAGQ